MSTITAKANTTIAYTDGSCKQDNTGGWGVYFIFSDGPRPELYGGQADTTNNQMEMMATIQAIKHSPKEPLLELWTDSSYVKKGITEWINSWKKNGWKTAGKKPVKNKELWQQLDELNQNRQISWNWIKGHAGHEGNEKADELANKGVLNPNGNLEKIMIKNTDTPKPISPIQDSQDQEVAVKFDGDTSRSNPHFKPLLPAPIHKNKPNRQLIMDTETTGFHFNNGDRIVEVGIVEMVGRKFTGEKLHVYINPNRNQPMSAEVIRVHGITDAFLADQPTFDKVAQPIYDFMIGADVIAHNASFDMNFLNMEFAKVGLLDFSQRVNVIDTLVIAKKKYPGQRNNLDALVKRLHVGKQDRTFHGALLDSEILAEVYLAMTGGQVTLAIDEKHTQDGSQNHKQFAEFANLLITAPTEEAEHDQWLQSLNRKYPNICKIWQ